MFWHNLNFWKTTFKQKLNFNTIVVGHLVGKLTWIILFLQISRAGRSVPGIGIPVFRYYRKWTLSTDYLHTDPFKKILNTCYRKWSCQLSVVGIFKNLFSHFRSLSFSLSPLTVGEREWPGYILTVQRGKERKRVI